MGRYRSGQPGLTVNQLAYAFVGSNPTRPTIMKISVIKSLLSSKGPVVLFLPKSGLSKGQKELDKTLDKVISKVIEGKDFIGNFSEVYHISKSLAGREVILVGAGDSKDLVTTKIQLLTACAVKYAQSKKIENFSIDLTHPVLVKFGSSVMPQVILGLYKGSYQFNDYLTDKEAHAIALKNVDLILPKSINVKSATNLIQEYTEVAKSVKLVRVLGNLPPIEMTPTYLAKEAEMIAKANPKIRLTVWGRNEIVKNKLGGLNAVSLGSLEEPRFIIMEYFNAPKSAGTYVVAGKGVTFDSGGISIKPANKMDEMKMDMLGGAVTLGVMQAVAVNKLKINIVGLVPATENMPGHKAYRPGDIIIAYNGKTIEVLNTDAEGRIILADALSYASKYKPKAVIDLATLTGACVVALGEKYAGLFTRQEKLAKNIIESSDKTGEQLWRLPLDDNFKEAVKSKIADVRNQASSRYGDASHGAAFLEHFTDYPWAHLDIAGPMWSDETPFNYNGATGYGVQLVYELAKKWAK